MPLFWAFKCIMCIPNDNLKAVFCSTDTCLSIPLKPTPPPPNSQKQVGPHHGTWAAFRKSLPEPHQTNTYTHLFCGANSDWQNNFILYAHYAHPSFKKFEYYLFLWLKHRHAAEDGYRLASLKQYSLLYEAKNDIDPLMQVLSVDFDKRCVDVS